MSLVNPPVAIGPPSEDRLPISDWFGGSVAFLLSMVIHASLLLILALFALPAGDTPTYHLLASQSSADQSSPTDSESIEFSVSRISSPQVNEAEEIPVQVAILEPLVEPDLDAGDSPDAADESRVAQDPERWLQLAGSVRQLPVKKSRGSPKPQSAPPVTASLAPVASTDLNPNKPLPRLTKGASYYGIDAPGKRFVFVVDSSTSMMGIRWQSAVRELLKCLSELPADSEYFLIFFSDRTDFLYNKNVADVDFQIADADQVENTRNWIARHNLGRSTRPHLALYTAVRMQPDAIFLLSDGEFRDDSLTWVRNLSVHANRTGQLVPPIHSIGLFSNMGLSTLMEIAQLTKGEFRQVAAPFGIP